MASRFHGKRVQITDCEAMRGSLISEVMRAEGADAVADHRDLTRPSAVKDLIHDIAFRFRRWRADQQTWAALRDLDDRQLKEFGIHPRPPDLIRPKFP